MSSANQEFTFCSLGWSGFLGSLSYIFGLNLSLAFLSKIITCEDPPNSNLPSYCPFYKVSPSFTIELQLDTSAIPI